MKDLYSLNSVRTDPKNIRSGKLKTIALLSAFTVMTSLLTTACSMQDVKDFISDVYKGADVVSKKAEDIAEDITGSSDTDENIGSDVAGLFESVIENSSSYTYPTKEMQDDWDEIGLSDSTIASVQNDQIGLYYYDSLNLDEQKLYAEIYYILSNQAEYIYITSTDMEEVEKVQQCVQNDHPEIFYLDGYLMNRYMTSDSEEIKALTYGGKYTLTTSEIEARNERLKAAADNIIAGMPDTTDEYEIVKYFYDYIVLHTEYQIGSEDNQNICSVLLNGASVCQGYAKTLQYLLQKVGITCEMVSGTVDNGSTTSSHAWNIVKVNGNWYYVDPTWGDSSFTGSLPGDTEVVNYAYLCVTTSDLATTHTTDEVVELPECNSTADNYFVRENALFDSVDKEKLHSLFLKEAQEGKSCVTFKCTNAEVFEQMKAYLFSDNGGAIFEYLPSDATRASYISQDTTLTYMIWL